jgi:hypothetical protein
VRRIANRSVTRLVASIKHTIKHTIKHAIMNTSGFAVAESPHEPDFDHRSRELQPSQTALVGHET